MMVHRTSHCPNLLPGSKPHRHRSNASTIAAVMVAVATPPSTFTPQMTRLSAPSISANVRHTAPVAPVIILPETIAKKKKSGETLALIWREI